MTLLDEGSKGVPDIYFHVGLPKTATTFLQRKFFPHLKGIHFTKKHHFKYHERIIKETQSDSFLFSCEYDRGMEKVLLDFSAKYPEAKIIISFRRHDKWISSKYKYDIRKSGYKKFEEFFSLDKKDCLWKEEDLYFMNYIKLIEKYFKNPPLIIFQDELKNKPYMVFDRISNYLNASYEKEDIKLATVKKAYDDKQLYIVRGFNKIVKHNSNLFKKGFIRKFHKKSHAFFLHLTAAIAKLIPNALVPSDKLIPSEELKRIKNFYHDDWEKCYEYAYGKKIERQLDIRRTSEDIGSAARA